MAQIATEDYLKLVPVLKLLSQKFLWSSYDAEADVLYVNFKKPSHATDSELTDDDVVIRYEGDEVIGLTVLHASQRYFAKGIIADDHWLLLSSVLCPLFSLMIQVIP